MDPRPCYKVGAAGLDPRDWRLIEIVFKHSQYNRYEFTLVEDPVDGPVDILIVNTTDSQAVKVAAGIRASGRTVPIIAAVPRGAPSAARHAISIDRLTLQLLPILNRVVELELSGRDEQHGFAPTATLVPPSASGGSLPPHAAGAGSGPDSASAPATDASRTGPASPAAAAAAAVNPTAANMAASMATGSTATGSPATPPNASGPTASGSTAPASSSMPGRPVAASAPMSPGAGGPGASGAAKVERTARPPADSARPASAPASNLVAFPSGNTMEPPPATSPRLRVLVIDDSPTVRQQLTVAFERMGMACDTAANAQAGLERLAEQHFDLVLVDVIMPEMDGYKLTREIKRNKRTRQIPVIILTSKSSPFDLARGALAGCDSFLSKPVPLKALEAAALKHLRKSLAIDDLSSLLRPTPAVAPGGAGADPNSSGGAARPGRSARNS